MTFEDALYEVCFSLTAKDAREPFFVYSRIADLMGNSYDGKKKLEKFFTVEKRIGILAYVTRQVKGGARGAKERYEEVSDIMDCNSYCKLVDYMFKSRKGVRIDITNNGLEHAKVDEKSKTDDSEIQVPTSIKVRESKRQNAKVDNEVASKCESVKRDNVEQKESEAPTSASVSGGSEEYQSGGGTCLPMIFVVLLFVASGTALVLGGVLKTDWRIYKWIISVSSTVLIVMLVTGISSLLDFPVVDSVVYCVLVIANAALTGVFFNAYYVVCYWVSSTLVVTGIAIAIKAYEDLETACCLIDTGGVLVAIATIVANALVMNY